MQEPITPNDHARPEILKITKSAQYHTVEELFKKSQADSVYYTLLFLSAIIVATGLLLNNATVVIGGMLVAPLLSPMLIIALGITTGEVHAIHSSFLLVLKSFAIVIGVSFFCAFLLGNRAFDLSIFGYAENLEILYFIVAFTSGIAATFALVRKEVAEILPGIAVSVSIVPPLSAIGIGLRSFSSDIFQHTLVIFLFNFIGIVLGSLVIFSLLKFQKTEKLVHEEAKAAENSEQKIPNADTRLGA